VVNEDGISVEKEVSYDPDDTRCRAFNGCSVFCRDIDSRVRIPRLTVKKASKSKFARYYALDGKGDWTQTFWHWRKLAVNVLHQCRFCFDSFQIAG
ncbi:uncharacterized protein METZ01_LOCUS63815, partial [marine metagenome]